MHVLARNREPEEAPGSNRNLEYTPKPDFAGIVGAGPCGSAAGYNPQSESGKILRAWGKCPASPVPIGVLSDGVWALDLPFNAVHKVGGPDVDRRPQTAVEVLYVQAGDPLQ